MVGNMEKQSGEKIYATQVYNGCENSFVIRMYENKFDNSESAKKYCGNTYDGFILVKQNPLEMVIYNRDGSLATMCGNGIRCFIHYCYNHNLLHSKVNQVVTKSGIVQTKIISIYPFMVMVLMNEAKDCFHGKRYSLYPIEINHHTYEVNLIYTGVWHSVIIPTDFDESLVDIQEIFDYPLFHKEVNIDMVQFRNDFIYVKTYERGVGFTKACGTGVMAVYLVLRKLGKLYDNDVAIQTDGGMIRAGLNEFGPFIIGPSIAGKIINH